MKPESDAAPGPRGDSLESGIGSQPSRETSPEATIRALLRLELQNRVNEVLAKTASLEEAAPEILREIATKGDWIFAGLWMLDPAGERLRFVSAWPSEDDSLKEFLACSIETTLAPGEGLPGTAWAGNRSLWLPNFDGRFKFLRLDAANACGLKSGTCFPIRLAGKVLGIMEFFSREQRAEEPDFLASLDNLGNQIGQFAGRKREEAAVRRSEARFRAILDQAVEGIYLLDFDTMRVLEANRSFLDLVGYNLEELKGLTLYDLVDHDPASVDLNIRRAFEAGNISIGERRYRRKDGSTAVVEVSVGHLGLEFGRILCAMVHDLSSTKKAESERARLLEILEATPDFVGMADQQGRAFYGNKAMQGLRGLDAPELGRPILEAHPEWAAKIVLEQGLPVAAERGIWRGETALLDKAGEEIPVSQVIVAHRDEKGQVAFFSSIARDITEQKLAEEKLRRREAQLEVLLQSSRDLNSDLATPAVLRKLVRFAIELTEAKAGAAGLYVDGKVQFTEYFTGESWVPIDYGFPPGYGVPGQVLETGEAYIANNALEDPHVVPEIQSALGFTNLIDVPILDREGAFLGCFEIHDTLDGRPFGDEDLWVLRGLADAASAALRNARMIAERDQQEAALRHVQKIESLGVLAGGIAHDFNNLLAVISGNVALAQMRNEGGPEDTFLASIDEAVQRAADLTRQLLAYAGKGRSTTMAVDLNRMVEGMSKLLSVSCSKKAELEVHLEERLPPILADAAQLQQVVMNLVINASDALEGAAGWIRISTEFREVQPGTSARDIQGEFLPPGPYVTLSVSDNGCGMIPEVQGLIFDPFFSTKVTGRGLGLSAMLGILRSHRARIQLESAPGEGSTFTVFFQPGEGLAVSVAAEAGATTWRGSGRLLLVDDEEQVRHAIAPLLRKLGFEVVEASNGREAVTRYQREGPFRLVLMDLSMPHMDGLEAFREIRSLDPTAKVILLSGYDPTGALGSAEGLAGFLQKPFRFDRLKEALRTALDGV